MATAVLAGPGAAVDPILLERLGLKLGDRFHLGTTEVEVRAGIKTEPDKIAERLSFGPRVMVSIETLAASGLADLGSLARWRYAVALPDAERHADANLIAARRDVLKSLPEAGFTHRRSPQPLASRSRGRSSASGSS